MTKTFADQVRETEARHVLQTYKRAPIVLVRGQGPRVWDTEGKDYLDFTSGVGVASLGHANPGLARVVAEQASTLVHTSNLFFHPYQAELSEKLARLSGLDRAFFCNSGTEAMEACLKFARRYWYTKGERQRTEFVALTRAFHGRTFGSLSVTADPHYREPFEPLVPGVTFVDPGDPDALASAVTERTAAIVVEPIQGEGGVRPLSPAFVAALRAVAERTGTLVIADEVQSGLGRTGHAFYSTVLGLDPDLISVGKALGGGIPIGAALLRESIARRGGARRPRQHVRRQPAGLPRRPVLRRPAARRRPAGARRVGRRAFRSVACRALPRRTRWCRRCAARASCAASNSIGPRRTIVDAARPLGLLVNATARTVVRLLPPLTITAAEIDEAMDRLDQAFAVVEGGTQ